MKIIKIFFIYGIIATMLSCANSANHEVVDAITEYDNAMTCEQIDEELVKLQAIKDGVLKDKKDMTGADIVDGVLWFPINILVKQSNYSSALEAVKERTRLLQNKHVEKSCKTVVPIINEEKEKVPESSSTDGNNQELNKPVKNKTASVVERIRALNKLYLDGEIEEKEYEEKKKALLKEL